ncbi:MAG: sulfatase-like hydrolase/transferase, partial [Planctomycetes bacterium]|nr:sulfatase-like hydrolase/transferase [Planctomycetota bacterium]
MVPDTFRWRLWSAFRWSMVLVLLSSVAAGEEPRERRVSLAPEHITHSEPVRSPEVARSDDTKPRDGKRVRRPNILFITADHLRYDTLGFTGDSVIQTPAIDALAGRSVSFSNYFVQNPVCHPSRATIMTGRYPCNHGVRWNFSGLNENEVTLLEYLKKHGYTTACIGKYHLSQRRFERALDYKEASSIRNMRPNNPFIQYVKSRGYEYKTGFALPNFKERLCAVPQPDQPEDCHLDAYVGMRTREYLKRVDKSKPFFLWLGFYGPHHPYVPSGRFATMYRADQVPPFHRSRDDLKKKPIEYRLFFHVKEHKFYPFYNASEQTFREMKAAYYGMVSQLDWQLGLVLKTLKELGLEQNTIIVFTSDHGEFLGDHGIPGKGPFLLDCMLHVPCLIHAPGVGRQGVVCDELVESVDLFPTLCSLTGLKIPEWVQGRDLTPLVTGKRLSQYRSRTAIYA